MTDHFAEMPLHESPWAISGVHDPEDIENFIAHYRARAKRVAHLLGKADTRTSDPFMEGAQQAMSKFSIATRAHKITSSSSCSFAELKEGEQTTTFFIIADANAIKAQGPLIAHVQWCMLQELKRHPDKHRPVYVIADETSNFKLHDLGGLMTWARGYGVRMHLFLQNFSAFRQAYGKETLDTLLSEAEIQQFLPGIRSPEILDFLERKLGKKSVIVRGRRGSRERGGLGIDGVDYREEGRPLLYSKEIEREPRAILFIRRNKPMLVDVPAFAAIWPWRKQVGIDPFHKKRFLKPIKLRIRRSVRRSSRGFNLFRAFPFNTRGKDRP
jgi:type IV secretion system protein VirD4